MIKNKKVFEIGIVGVGSHMEENLFPVLRCIPNIRIKSLVSRSDSKQLEFQQKWEITDSYSNIDEMLSNETLDLVVCSGPPDFQKSIIYATIDEKISIFVEKPSCLDPKELSILQNKAINNMSVIFTGYNFIYSDIFNQYNTLVKGESRLVETIKFFANKPISKIWELSSIFESYIYAIGIHAFSMAYERLQSTYDVKILSYHEENGCFHSFIECFTTGGSIILELSNAYPFFDWQMNFFTRNSKIIQSCNFNSMTLGTSSDFSNIKNKRLTYNQPELKSGYTRTGYQKEMIEIIKLVKTKSCIEIEKIHKRDLFIIKTCKQIVSQFKEM